MSLWPARSSDQLLLKCCDRADGGPECFLGREDLFLICQSRNGQSKDDLETWAWEYILHGFGNRGIVKIATKLGKSDG